MTIRISPDGSISAQTAGAKGQECLELIPRLEALLEATTVDSDFTAEYYETADLAQTSEQRIVERET